MANKLYYLLKRILPTSFQRHIKSILDSAIDNRIKNNESVSLFNKAMWVAPEGDYVEFGTYDGTSLIRAYHVRRQIAMELMSGAWDHSFEDAEAQKAHFGHTFEAMRFIAFDSFEGIPEPQGIDKVSEVFCKGSYACDIDRFYKNIDRFGVPRKQVVPVKGFFADTCTEETRERIELKRAAIVHIDSDLYESAKIALDFITPSLVNCSIIIFDEWFQFGGNPNLGEQRAFREWRENNPQWTVTEFQRGGAWSNSFILSLPEDQS